MNNTAQKGNIVTALLIGVVFVGLIGLSFWYFYSSSTNQPQSNKLETQDTYSLPQQNTEPTQSPSSAQESQQYTSENLKISFEKPKNTKVEELFNAVKISYNDGEILIDRTSTIFTNINDHLKDLAKKNQLTYEETKKIETSGNTFIGIMLKSNVKPQGELSYFTLVNGFIYVVSTTNPQLNPSMETLISSIEFQ